MHYTLTSFIALQKAMAILIAEVARNTSIHPFEIAENYTFSTENKINALRHHSRFYNFGKFWIVYLEITYCMAQ